MATCRVSSGPTEARTRTGRDVAPDGRPGRRGPVVDIFADHGPARTSSGWFRTPAGELDVEELVNCVSHAAGLLLSLAGLYILGTVAGSGVRPTHAAGCSVYGVSMVLLYAASTLYHGSGPGRKRLFLLLDYSGIYLLIAGTYTPLILMAVPGPRGWAILAAVWGLAAIGVAWKARRFGRFEDDSPVLYLVMSGVWLAAFRPVVEGFPAGEFLWVVAGGAFYLAGLGFWFTSGRRFHHAIWHAFVLAGSICHFRAVVGLLAAVAA